MAECSHMTITIIVKRYWPATYFEPEEVEEIAFCNECGKFGDPSDFVESTVTRVEDASDLRRMPDEHFE